MQGAGRNAGYAFSVMRQNLLTLLGINVAAIQIAESGRALTTDVALMDMAADAVLLELGALKTRGCVLACDGRYGQGCSKCSISV